MMPAPSRAIVVALVVLTMGGIAAAGHDMASHGTTAAASAATGPSAGLPPAIPGLGGPFHLVDHTGTPRSDADFRGRFMLVAFGFTQCPDVCPLQLQTIGAALDRLPPDVAAKVAPLFITVDPQNDTPARLAAFVGPFHPALLGLTGSHSAIDSVTRAYRVHVLAAANGHPEDIGHTSFLYLMGPDGGFLSMLLPNATSDEIAARIAKYAG
jgi:protein SCO1/2